MARSKPPNTLIVVKRRGYEDEEEHTGAWKIAYADFVTSMMTFFLVMWLINITTKEQREGISEYFNPVAVSQANSGADGALAGRSVDKTGALTSPNASGTRSLPVASPPVVASVGKDDRNPAGRKDPTPNPDSAGQPATLPQVTRAEFEALLDRQSASVQEQMAFNQLEQDIRKQIAAAGDLKALSESIVIQQVPEGLRIQLTDQAKFSMFTVGSAQMTDQTRRLMRLVAGVIATVPNSLSISGHTDALAYSKDSRYGNWELSSDRANAARRELIASGVPIQRVVRVEGRADLDHMVENRLDPRNRRISITLLRHDTNGSPAATRSVQ
ncbi:flagellar motor protein MotB [Azospirillum sp. TSO22-1]|uniref:flagellar motor protein MotB n=1 Tax=Azospirillum sp. TSO22-1 TaxID=716789 RepID=UPI000D61321C|nr:flagellar motor protein MotB [Azospirillum sp. TSO22-1]PWC42575.1 chemotaxis protein [Azospirillum sp. TSO22-1]